MSASCRARRWCLFTAHDPAYAGLAEITLPGMRRYAARQGMEMRVSDGFAGDRPPAWRKVAFAKELLAEGFDFLFWIDIDAAFVRFDVDIRTRIEPGGDFYCVEESHPIAGSKSLSRLNTGVVVIRNTPAMHRLLDDAWAMTRFLHHEWWDQAAIIAAFGLFRMFPDLHHAPDRPHPLYHPLLRRLPPEWNVGIGLDAVERPIVMHAMGQSLAGKRMALRICRAITDAHPGDDGLLLSRVMGDIGPELFDTFRRGQVSGLSPDELNRLHEQFGELSRRVNSRGWLARQLWRRMRARLARRRK